MGVSARRQTCPTLGVCGVCQCSCTWRGLPTRVSPFNFPKAPLQGVIGEPPSKKHDPGKIPGTQTTLSPNPGKKIRFPPPGGWSSGGKIPTFFSKICDSMAWLPGILLKNWSKQGVPPFGALFGHFGPKWPKPVNSQDPLECKVFKKSVTYPRGVSSEATWRAYLGTGDTVRAKQTLQVASELTPRG